VNYTRIALAAIAATVVDMIYGFIVYSMALASEVSMYGGIFRPIEEVNANLPWLIIGLVLAMFATSYVYAKGYEAGSRVQQGLRFGMIIGLLIVGYVAIGNYVVMRIGKRLAVYMGAAALGEWIVIGLTVGLVYKPTAAVMQGR